MTGPLEAVAQAIADVLSEHEPVWAASIDMLVRCDCGHGHDIAGYDYDGHNAHVATEIAAALELREETREWENFPDGLEIDILTSTGLGHADCNKCNISEFGCYADLVKWSHNHAKEKHGWKGSTFERRWVSSWTSSGPTTSRQQPRPCTSG